MTTETILKPIWKGQITIPKDIRKKHGFNEGSDVIFMENNGHIRLMKSVNVHPVDQITGIMKNKINTDEFINNIRGK